MDTSVTGSQEKIISILIKNKSPENEKGLDMNEQYDIIYRQTDRQTDRQTLLLTY